MDGARHRMSPIPETLLPENALAVESWLPGGMDGCPHGRRHRKTAPATIVAIVERGAYEVGRSDGSCQRATAGEAFLAQEGDWLDIVHHADRPGGTFAACWTHLRVSVFGSLDACRLLALPPVLAAAPAAEIRGHIAATRAALPGLGGAARRAEAAMATLRILAGVAPPSAEGRQLLARAAGLAPLATWVRAHLAEPIRLDDLAAVAGVSKSRLHARFQAELGLPPLAWVRELRLQAARDRLLATGEAVAGIGAACGFPDQFHFSRAVRARFGLSPLRLRAQGRLGGD
ncbi:MAG: AraC family transcriptional regulator [Planctomycetes bacterium]|nr:AraC family transcriptional regulator [Planctomycetota bacterium]